jgi:hypothetical protein
MAITAALAGNSTIMVRKNVAEILTDHVTFELEAIDRMYLNAYVPSLQMGGGVVYFLNLGVKLVARSRGTAVSTVSHLTGLPWLTWYE